jgi:hypothetical protein
MAAEQQRSGKPWSGTNKIPTVNQFISNLDRDKAKRDQEIDSKQGGHAQYSSEVTPHQSEKPKKEGKTVTDPVTGNNVVIADVGKEYMKRADNPQVRMASKPCFQLLIRHSYQCPTRT